MGRSRGAIVGNHDKGARGRVDISGRRWTGGIQGTHMDAVHGGAIQPALSPLKDGGATQCGVRRGKDDGAS